MSRFLSKKYQTLVPYTPGEQPRDKKYIKLNTNESPYPPSDGVLEAVNELAIKDLRLYSDPTALELKMALGGLYGKDPAEVFISNGSDDILNFAFMAYGHLGAIYSDITYGFACFKQIETVGYTHILQSGDVHFGYGEIYVKGAIGGLGGFLTVADKGAYENA